MKLSTYTLLFAGTCVSKFVHTMACDLVQPGVTIEISQDGPDIKMVSSGCFSDTTIFDDAEGPYKYEEAQMKVDDKEFSIDLGFKGRLVAEDVPLTLDNDCSLLMSAEYGRTYLNGGSSMLPIGFSIEEGDTSISAPEGVSSDTDFQGHATFSDTTMADLGFTNAVTGQSCRISFDSDGHQQFIEIKFVESLSSFPDSKICNLVESGVTIEFAQVNDSVQVCSTGCFTNTDFVEEPYDFYVDNVFETDRYILKLFSGARGNYQYVRTDDRREECDIRASSKEVAVDEGSSILPIALSFEEGEGAYVPYRMSTTTSFNGGRATFSNRGLSDLGLKPNGSCRVTFSSGDTDHFIEFKVVDSLACQPGAEKGEDPVPPSTPSSNTFDMFDIAYADATFVDSTPDEPTAVQNLDALKLMWTVGDEASTEQLSVDFQYYEPGCQTKLTDTSGNLQGSLINFEGSKDVPLVNTLSKLADAGLRTKKNDSTYKYAFCVAISVYDRAGGSSNVQGQVGNVQYVDVVFEAEVDGTINTDSTTVSLDTVTAVDDSDGTGLLTASLYKCSSTSGSTALDDSAQDLYSTDDGATTSERKPLYLCLVTDNDQTKIRKIKKLDAYFAEQTMDDDKKKDKDKGKKKDGRRSRRTEVTMQTIVYNDSFQGPLSIDNQGGVAACQNEMDSEVSECKFAVFLRGDEFPLGSDGPEKAVNFEGTVELVLAGGRRKLVRTRSLVTVDEDYKVGTTVSLSPQSQGTNVVDDADDEDSAGCFWSFLNLFGLDIVCQMMSALISMLSNIFG